jgi:hypothetical protein
VQFHGLPAAAVEFLPSDGNVVRLSNGTWVSTVSVWFAKDAPQNITDPALHCCNVSVTIFASSDSDAGTRWRYVSTVATPAEFRAAGGDEGPNENALLLHPDGHTITILLRTAGGEGYPDHHHLSYFRSTSTDGGASWDEQWSRTPDAVKSGRPAHASIRVTPSREVLLLSSGRPGLGIHESTDGLGLDWVTYDIPTEHNRLMRASVAAQQVDGATIADAAALEFCPQFMRAPLDGSLGWTQTSGVTVVQPTSALQPTFLVCYNRVCCPTVRTDCHVAPPAACRCNGTEFFCMKGHVV